jgi:hypothetical protein
MASNEITEVEVPSSGVSPLRSVQTEDGNHATMTSEERQRSGSDHSKTVVSVEEVPSSPPGRTILTEADYPRVLARAYSTRKRWTILSIIFLVQCSMNFNTSLYSNGLIGMSEEFGITVQTARTGAAIFLVTYAFGCEL